ncbi:MAG: metal ABC transporter ATP-binding protein [Patescibacteria group bacterium]|nr:metal ABC transporter ATP-binding protein [Patescibacteria group bacterium]
MPLVLDVQNLSVALGGHHALSNVSFGIEEGETLVIIGPNGSGKTVLLRTLLGMLPSTGKIEWNPSARIGYVPQKIEADRHLPISTINLLRAKAKILKFPDSDILHALHSVGLTTRIAQIPVGHLSGGEFQRALIAFALLGKPTILLFDEPTASIDKPGEEQIYELLHRLQDEYRLTAIVISHDLSFVYRHATKVLCLNKVNVCFGTPKEALDIHMLETLYGGPHKYFHHLHDHTHHS